MNETPLARYVPDEAIGAALEAAFPAAVTEEEMKAAITAALPHVLAEIEDEQGYATMPALTETEKP